MDRFPLALTLLALTLLVVGGLDLAGLRLGFLAGLRLGFEILHKLLAYGDKLFEFLFAGIIFGRGTALAAPFRGIRLYIQPG